MSCSDTRELAVLRRPLIWLNLVCLDAPIVAISWQWLFGHTFGISIPLAEREALFLTAWAIYLVDRLADSVSLPINLPKAARQEFCWRHRTVWIFLIVVSALADLAIILRALGRETVIAGVFLGAVATGYLAINHVLNRFWRAIPLKEISVGFLFAAGTLLVLAARVSLIQPNIVLAAILFAILCTLNCVSIAIWERDLDLAQAKHSIATRWPQIDTFARVALFALATATAVLAVINQGLWSMWACLGASALLLAALHFVSIPRDERTALADLVLFAPLALMFLL